MPSFFSNVAAQAKTHHAAVTAAYASYYAPGFATSSPAPSRSTSVTSSSSAPRTGSRVWTAIKKHHRELSGAYATYYSPGVSIASSRSSSVVSSPKSSFEKERKVEKLKPTQAEKIWSAIKTRAVEHHRSVNAAARAPYGY